MTTNQLFIIFIIFDNLIVEARTIHFFSLFYFYLHNNSIPCIMKTLTLKLFFTIIFSIFIFPQLHADVTKTIGSDGDYTTLKSAFDAINAGTIKIGVITLQIISSTTEKASAKLNTCGSGSTNFTSLIIYSIGSGVQLLEVL